MRDFKENGANTLSLDAGHAHERRRGRRRERAAARCRAAAAAAAARESQTRGAGLRAAIRRSVGAEPRRQKARVDVFYISHLEFWEERRHGGALATRTSSEDHQRELLTRARARVGGFLSLSLSRTLAIARMGDEGNTRDDARVFFKKKGTRIGILGSTRAELVWLSAFLFQRVDAPPPISHLRDASWVRKERVCVFCTCKFRGSLAGGGGETRARRARCQVRRRQPVPFRVQRRGRAPTALRPVFFPSHVECFLFSSK